MALCALLGRWLPAHDELTRAPRVNQSATSVDPIGIAQGISMGSKAAALKGLKVTSQRHDTKISVTMLLQSVSLNGNDGEQLIYCLHTSKIRNRKSL